MKFVLVYCDHETGLCDTTIINVVVTPPASDTITVTIPTETTDTLCVPIPDGVTADEITIGDCGHGTPITNISTDSTCLIITSTETVGIDTLCVVLCDAVTSICDTIPVIVVVEPSTDTVSVVMEVNSDEEICIDIEEGMNDADGIQFCDQGNGTITPTLANDSCLTITSGSASGVDEICVIYCDDETGLCDTTIINVVVTPPASDTITGYYSNGNYRHALCPYSGWSNCR